MGTLFNQPPRYESLVSCTNSIRRIAVEFGFDLDNMTPADWHAACDITRTALAIQNADVSDEQFAGFGEIFKEFNAAVRKLSEALDTIAEVYDHVSAESLTNE